MTWNLHNPIAYGTVTDKIRWAYTQAGIALDTWGPGHEADRTELGRRPAAQLVWENRSRRPLVRTPEGMTTVDRP